ncbi:MULTISPECIES: cobyric acid synthase [Halobacterium]|uniref:cobyric acid synthase n=1 Tax=Halobacterium TaxID=2239 RepID=UPI001964BDDC|nr:MULTISPECIES: cobyric acid synthase [Halobacterium]MCF2165983.1 cobyric acid synthase [Halobacterium salinarum]MCF2167503.1 cobyric acid synthase [Halobacterium salinarum]MCF2239380.1 cobyric acid synthase [Halobacterium salinarum]QRY21916.1 cobyric acid synthase [Halobacterium sp. GSL-19]WJK63309.1 cobyric acid synthase [Halobacterium salinarum]
MTAGEDCRTILVAGTASHVGKSTVAAGLCRLLADRGLSVAPFKAQNMSNNARAVPVADGAPPAADPWGEIGVSQYVQARAARTAASTDHNPVLLKPRGDAESQLVVDGRAVGHYSAGSYYESHWADARDAAAAAHARLAADNDVVVAEGAGSIAELNLHDRDLANLETARFADATILLVVDIERGGAFASLHGTLALLPDDIHDRVAGAVITKFRGDRSLLDPGITEIEARTGVPVLGVIPHDDPGLPAEDSVSLPDPSERVVDGGQDGVPDAASVTVAVPHLPHISNFTDLAPLARTPGVRVAYQPLDAPLAAADAVVLPGTKNTVDDLRAARGAGLGRALRAFDGPIVGLCGGYQMLGDRITNAATESTADDLGAVDGVGVLPVETAFQPDKRVEAVTRELADCGALGGATGAVTGYEIHMGRTTVPDGVPQPVGPASAARGRVLGTYLHGLFGNDAARRGFRDAVFAAAGVEQPAPADTADRSPSDAAAALVDAHVDLDPLGVPPAPDA